MKLATYEAPTRISVNYPQKNMRDYVPFNFITFKPGTSLGHAGDMRHITTW